MTDVWDLSAYVEAHPDDLDQRWRLAKKLYTAFEYRLALEHLLVLKNEWGPRANVTRYLAATYYRLGRYDEAIREMRNALDKFPDDVAMREQFARTLAVDDEKEAAVAEWKVILEKKPDHRFAKSAVKKLQKAIDKENAEKEEIRRSKIGEGISAASLEDVSTELVCPSCGEKNAREFKRCWKCHALLNTGAPAAPSSAFTEKAAAPVRVKWPLVVGVILAALFALSVFLTLRGVSQTRTDAGLPTESVFAFINSTVLWTRVGLGVVLLVVWPLAWRAGAYVANAENKIYNDALYQYGAVLALSTYAMLWLPWRWVIVALIAPVVFSAVIAFLALSLPPRAAAALWSVQIAAVLIAATLLIVFRHGAGIILDAPTIARRVSDANERSTYSSVLSAPGEIHVTWTGSGSDWLDHRISSVQIAVEPAQSTRPLFLETLKPDGPPTYEQIRGDCFISQMDTIRPGQAYSYRIHSRGDPVGVSFTISGLLRPRVELAPFEPVPAGS